MPGGSAIAGTSCCLFDLFGRRRAAAVAAGEVPGNVAVVSLAAADGTHFELPAQAACLSHVLRHTLARRHAAPGGHRFEVAGDIQVSLEPPLLAKVVDYLRYHADVPAAELRLPLESDDLRECGVLEWDAKFVDVDKDSLFELVLAGVLLEIPSLAALAVAKIARMVRRASVATLQRNFGFADDIAAREMDLLQDGFTEARLRLGFKDQEELNIAQAVVAMGGVARAAERHGVLSAGIRVPTPASTKESWRVATWRAALLENWRLLGEAPEDFCKDRALIEALLPVSRGEALALAAEELKADEELVLLACSHGEGALRHAVPALRGDRGFVLRAVERLGGALAGAEEHVRADGEVVLLAARMGRGSALQGATPSLRSEPALVAESTECDPEALRHADEGLRHHRPFALEVAGRRGAALRHMPHQLRADSEVVRAAVGNDPAAVSSAHAARRAELLFGASEPWPAAPAGDAAAAAALARAARRGAPDGPEGEGEEGTSLPTLVAAGRLGEERWAWSRKLQKAVWFSGIGTFLVGLGQGNYNASNMVLEKMPGLARPEIDGDCLQWGGMGSGIGMRWKAFGSADALMIASIETMLTIMDGRGILEMVCTKVDVPELLAVTHMDEALRHAIGSQQQGGGWWPTETSLLGKAGDPGGSGRKVSLAEASTGPLEGWPLLCPATPSEAGRTGSVVREGSRVQICGLHGKGKNGARGTAVKQTGVGRWKVKLDGGGGVALLQEQYLRLALSPERVPCASDEEKAPTAARRLVGHHREEPRADRAPPAPSARRVRKEAEALPCTVAAVLHKACSGWSEYAVELKVGALEKVGIRSVLALQAALGGNGGGDVEVNARLVAAGKVAFTPETLRLLGPACQKALANTCAPEGVAAAE